MTTKKSIRAKDSLRKIRGPASFGDMVFAFRVGHEFTQVEMAKILGVSKQDLCNIEKGRKLVSVERAMKFAIAMGMPPKTFVKYVLQDQLRKAGIKGEVIIHDAA